MQRVPTFITMFVFLTQSRSVLAYTAAVLEYNPLYSDMPKSTILFNLEEYRTFAAQAKAKGADIIVFPEYGLTTLPNSTKRHGIEINSYSDVVNRLQKMAFELEMYMVVNLLERVQISSCCDGPQFFNTNLVFARNGSLIRCYRKINLVKEDWLAPGALNQTLTFDTDFGAFFALFTSHDILFANPSRDILKKGVTDVAYPVAWTSTLPLYFNLAIQYGYFMSTGVNILASSYNLPPQHLSGSGIYSGQNVKTFLTDKLRSKLIVMNVTRQEKDDCSNFTIDPYLVYSNIEAKNWTKDFYYSIYNFKGIEIENSSTEICFEDFCCTFDIIFSERNASDYFKVMAFDDLLFFDRQRSHVRMCFLLACENDSDESCGGKIQTYSTFSKIKVTREVSGDATYFYMPLTLKFNLQPLERLFYCPQTSNSSRGELETTDAEGILVFGFFGIPDSACLCYVHKLVLMICVFWFINVIIFL